MKRLFFYMLRWQGSTPVLAIVIWLLSLYGITNSWTTAFIANIVGSLIFYSVDKYIFKSSHFEIWNTREGVCNKCGKEDILWRLVKAPKYDKMNSEPVFLCMECSKEKTEELRSKGINVKGRSK